MDVKQNPSEQKGDVLVNPRIFAKMLLGYRSLDELEAEYPDVRIKPEYKQIMEILFPKGTATSTLVTNRPSDCSVCYQANVDAF